MIPLISPHPVSAMPCGPLMPLLQSPPGSRRGWDYRTTSVQLARIELTHRPPAAPIKRHITASIFRDRSDGGFRTGRRRQPVEIHSDLFHRRRKTGLRKDEPRLNLCSHASDREACLRAREHEEMGVEFDPRLSTAFADAAALLPPAVGPGK